MPVSVTVDPDGIVCVTDATSAAGHLVDERDVHIFSTSEAATLGNPIDLTVEIAGGFVCTDARADGGRTIVKLDFFGQPIPYAPVAVADVWSPERLLVTQDGNYVTTDPTNRVLAKHEAKTGELLWKTDITEALGGELVALGRPGEAPDGKLLVPVPGIRQIAVFSAGGEYLTSFGTPGATLGRMAFPIGVACCPGGTIAVLDQMRHLVLLFDDQYRFISEFGSFGRGPADLYYPAAIAVSPDGLIYVAQGFEGRIQQFQLKIPESGAIDGSHPRRCEAGREERRDRSQRGGVVHAYLSR
jgi:DNA-binding beta-propeller fold protein YncE